VRRETRLPSDARRPSQPAHPGAAFAVRRPSVPNIHRRPHATSGHVRLLNTYQLQPATQQRFKASVIRAIFTEILHVGLVNGLLMMLFDKLAD
jgi:hypothetical protein